MDNDAGIGGADDDGVGIGRGRDPGKSPEKEPILCHCIDQPRHGEYGTQETGRENGNTYEDVQKQGRQWLLIPSLQGQDVLPSCLSIPRAGIPEHLTVTEEKAMTLTWMKEHRGCQQPQHIWQGPTQHGEKPVERGCEFGSRAP